MIASHLSQDSNFLTRFSDPPQLLVVDEQRANLVHKL